MKTLMSLAKKIDFETESEYFDYCIDSYLNGQFNQCKNLFSDMPKPERKNLITYINNSGMLSKDISNCRNFYFNLL